MKIKIIKISSLFLLLLLTTFVYKSYAINYNTANKTNKNKVKSSEFMEGDIIFQTSNSLQSKAIQLATKSEYSHVGILINHNGKLVVLEAVQPIKYTPIDAWIKHGEKSTYSLKRLKNRNKILNETALKKMRLKGSEWIGKNYDIAFDWSDKKLYCSELVWKLYKEGCGIEVGELKKLKTYDLSHPIVTKAMEQRYGENIPWEEEMISPQSIYESNLLELIN